MALRQDEDLGRSRYIFAPKGARFKNEKKPRLEILLEVMEKV